MKNTELKNIAIGSGSHKKARFNLSHDVNSTYQFGEVQPVLFRDMISGEKDVVDIESMVRLAPMVAPTFGRIVHKEWHHFIPFTDLFPHYGNFLAQNSYRGQVPAKLPAMSLGILSYFCLVGARMTIYQGPTYTGTNYDGNAINFALLKNSNVTTTTTDITNLLTWITEYQQTMGLSSGSSAFDYSNTSSSSLWHMGNGFTLDLRYVINGSLIQSIYGRAPQLRSNMKIPIGNWDTHDFFDYEDKSLNSTSGININDVEPVMLDAADAVLPYCFAYNNGGTKREALLAFRFSNFGKRLYKILTGLGYTLDFESTQYVSLMPLFAFYKAWFDNFGITRTSSWTDTSCYRLMSMYDYAPSNWDFNQVIDQGVGNYFTWSDWVQFIVELGNCWVTEDVDFVTAHSIESPNMQSNAGANGFGLFDNVPDYNAVNAGVNRSQTSLNGMYQSNPSINVGVNAAISALDIKQVMQMYRWVNRNSVAGRACEDVLRAQGYGYYLYSCKSNFIGYTEQHVQVYDVVSSSDTFNSSSDDGALLGQQAGRGIGVDKSKTLSFEATEDGYWIGLCAVVPKAGYSQSLNASLVNIDKFSRYNPDLDGKYMVLSPKSFVHGSKPFAALHGMDQLKDAFGFVPIYSALKIANNVSNGGFSLRSQRKIFEPYMLDKVLDVGERQVILYNTTTAKRDYRVIKLFETLPSAGEFWRYLCRYPWLGNFDRIFARALTNGDNLNIANQTTTPDDCSFEYLISSDDNLMVHHVVNQVAYSPMLPIEESFSTEDENGNFDSSVKME